MPIGVSSLVAIFRHFPRPLLSRAGNSHINVISCVGLMYVSVYDSKLVSDTHFPSRRPVQLTSDPLHQFQEILQRQMPVLLDSKTIICASIRSTARRRIEAHSLN